MANTLTSTELSLVAQESLDLLKASMFPTRAFTRDFSGEMAGRGKDITTHIITEETADDLSGGYTASDANTTPVVVTLDQFKGKVFKFHDTENAWAQGGVDWLRRAFAPVAANATVKAIMLDALGLVTSANYSASVLTLPANLDADAVADLAEDLTTAKAPRRPRSLIVLPTYFATLQKDSVVQDASSYGSPAAIQEHEAKRVHGFDVYEYADLPANGQSLTGVACHPSAIALAARAVPGPENAPHVQWTNVVDDETGLPVQVRYWYDANGGNHYMSMAVLYGVAVGQAAALKRVRSA